MRYCHYCGHVVPDDARFCPACGKDLTLPSIKQPETAPRQQTQRPKEPAIKPGGEVDAMPEKKQSSLWGCTIIVLIVALLAGGILFTYNQLFNRSNYSNILAPKDDAVSEEQLPSREQAASEPEATTVERPAEEPRNKQVIVEEESVIEVEEPEEILIEEDNNTQEETTNNSQEN